MGFKWAFYPEFAAGFVYGVLYGLDKLEDNSWYLVVYFDQMNEEEAIDDFLVYDDFEDLYLADSPLTMFYGVTVTLNEITLQRLQRFNENRNKYIFWLRYKTMSIAASGNEDFLQGLFSALDASNIPREEVLLTRPYKQGVFYNVNNMQLLTPQ